MYVCMYVYQYVYICVYKYGLHISLKIELSLFNYLIINRGTQHYDLRGNIAY